MQTIHKEIPLSSKDKLTQALFTEDSIFFDIETTGFAPAYTSLYLIGCARRRGNSILIDQFFAGHPTEEAGVLAAFLELLSSCSTIITFNGIGFDIPYLKAKCDTYHIAERFADFDYIDIFKSISKLKHILNLENLKQKTIEHFLSLERSDLYSGGELIQIYAAYGHEPEQALLDLLLLHNYEDVLGMIDILPVLSYPHLFNGLFERVSFRQNEYLDFRQTDTRELIFDLTPEYPFPQRISYRRDDIYLTACRDSCRISIRLTLGELKYFFPNYKEYYYLPDEDTAMHKSVSSYVDKKHRQQAKACNCYTRHTGVFLPQFEEVITPCFRREYKDKISYFELTEPFLSSSSLTDAYVAHIIAHLAKKPSAVT